MIHHDEFRRLVCTVDDIDSFAYGVLRLMIFDVTRHVCVRAATQGRIQEIHARTAAHGHLPDHGAGRGIRNMGKAQFFADRIGKHRHFLRFRQDTDAADARQGARLFTQGFHPIQAQQFRQDIVDSPNRAVQVRMGAENGDVLPRRVQQQGCMPVFVRQMADSLENRRMVGHDQIRAEFPRLGQHLRRIVQGAQDDPHRFVRAAHHQPYVVPFLRQRRRGNLIQDPDDVLHCGKHQ